VGAVGFAEHVVLIKETRTDEKPLLEHPPSMIAKDAHRMRIERDWPPPRRRLRLSGDKVPPDRSERLRDPDTSGSEIDVGPMEAKGLAAPQCGCREEDP